MPQVNSDVVICGDTFRVISVNTLQESVTVRDNDRFFEVSARDLRFSKGKYHLNEKAAQALFNPDEQGVDSDEECF